MWWWTWVGCASTPEERLARGLAATDPAAAIADLGPACDAGLVAACDAAGAAAGPSGGVVPDAVRHGWDERACDGGIAAACARRAEAPDDRWTRSGCALGDAAACAAVAGVDPTMRDEACRAGHLPSCLPAGDAARAAGDLAGAKALYGIRCAAEPEGTACALVARVDDPAPIGEVAWPTGDREVADALWARCDADDGWACVLLAEHVDRGAPLPKGARGGPDWLRDQACDLQVQYTCAPHAR